MAGTTPVLSVGSPLFCCAGATSSARVLCDLLVIFSASSQSIFIFNSIWDHCRQVNLCHLLRNLSLGNKQKKGALSFLTIMSHHDVL